MDNILSKKIALVILDVDGTLYDQSRLRKFMLFHLLRYYSVRPWKLKEVLIIYHFRKEREKRQGLSFVNLQQEQYSWAAVKSNANIDKVEATVQKWMFEVPKHYLHRCVFPGVPEFIHTLREKGIKTAIYSDYAARDKIVCMGLTVDSITASTDKEVNALKPLPNGLNFILSRFPELTKEECLFLGDRYELDGKCAENAGIAFLLVNSLKAAKDFYYQLNEKFDKKQIIINDNARR